MPGIVGIISPKSAAECRASVSQMVETMRHESFYETAMCAFPEMGIYAGGVALEDSFAENPVLFNEDKSVALIFSGECFLDAATGTDLKARGHSIRENRAEWLPHFYEEQGNAFFENLNGIFSGLLIDRRRQIAFLFNDRYGLGRVYYHESNGILYFASEAKALLQVLPQLREFDPDGVADYLACGCPLNWKTLFRGIKILPGGSRWKCQNSVCIRENYFSPVTWSKLPELSESEFESQFQEIWKRISPRYFHTNGNLGLALTAGLDTRMILAGLSAEQARPICYTFTGERNLTLDDEIAARLSAACGCQHELLRLTPKFFSDFAAHVDHTVFLTDGCFGLTGAHEVLFNRLARDLAATRVTGVFGGEVFRSVSTFKPTGISRDLISWELHSAMNLAERHLEVLKKNRPAAFAAFYEVPWSLFGSMKASASQVNFRSPYLDNELVRLAHQTPQHWQKSSVPAMNLVAKFNPRLAAIPTDMGIFGTPARRVFSKIAFKLDYICNDGLTRWLSPMDGILDQFIARRIIFGKHKFLRYRRWLRRELAGYVADALAGVSDNSFWNKKILRQLASQHLAGRGNLLCEINAILTLDAVERKLFRELSRNDVDKKIISLPQIPSGEPVVVASA